MFNLFLCAETLSVFLLNAACTMYKSLIEKKPVEMDSKSIASGLAPPFAGSFCQISLQHIWVVCKLFFFFLNSLTFCLQYMRK